MKDSNEGNGMFTKAQRSRVYYLVNSLKIPPGGADDQLATGSGSILTLWAYPLVRTLCRLGSSLRQQKADTRFMSPELKEIRCPNS